MSAAGTVVDRAAYDIGPGDVVLIGRATATVIAVIGDPEVDCTLHILHDGPGPDLVVASTDTVAVVES